MISPTRPRYLAGISSSMAELIAAYSPPMPRPVRKRKIQNEYALQVKPVRIVATRYRPRLAMNSFLRPSRSVR